MSGLPPHIAQIIAGHQDLNVTMGYKAVYPDEAIQAHLAFLTRRRALRPSEEYRSPTGRSRVPTPSARRCAAFDAGKKVNGRYRELGMRRP